mgnify:CR=1 FL=1
MTALQDWFAMNGYAGYVWSAYGLMVFVLLGNVLLIRRQRLRVRMRLRAWFKRSSI